MPSIMLEIGRRESAWSAPSMSDLWDAVKTAADTAEQDSFSRLLEKVKYPTCREKNIEDLLSRCQISEQIESIADVKDFMNLAEKEIANKCRFVSPGQSLATHEDFLLRIAGRSTQKTRARLFTINYDLCFEIAAANIGFAKIDGFSLSNPRQFSPAYFDYDFVTRDENNKSPHFVENVFQFYKLHGSVDWTNDNNSIIQDPETESPLLI